MNDCVRIVPFKVDLAPMWYKLQIKKVWIRIGSFKLYSWRTVGEYAIFDCAVLDAKIAMKCLNGEWGGGR